MPVHPSQRLQIFVTAIAAVYVWSLLLWEHFHGGIVSHHILHRADLPAISNAWGGLVLPVLTWVLTGCVKKREPEKLSRATLAAFFGAILYGTILSIAFVNRLEPVYSPMGPGLLLIALFLPIYRAEYVLGFVLSMTYVFGALLPTGFAAVVALIAFVLYRFIRPIPWWLAAALTKSKGGEEDS